MRVFYPMPVCLVATSHKNHRLDLRENFTRDVALDKEVTVKFWESYGSDPGIFLEGIFIIVRYSAYVADNSRSCRQIPVKVYAGWDVSLATNKPFDLVLIWEIETEILPLCDGINWKTFFACNSISNDHSAWGMTCLDGGLPSPRMLFVMCNSVTDKFVMYPSHLQHLTISLSLSVLTAIFQVNLC